MNEDVVELLQRMVPNEDETKAYREFDAARKDINELTEEDKVRTICIDVGTSVRTWDIPVIGILGDLSKFIHMRRTVIFFSDWNFISR